MWGSELTDAARWSNVEPERRDSLCCWVQCDIFQCAQEGLQVAAKAKSCIKRGLYGETGFSAVADTLRTHVKVTIYNTYFGVRFGLGRTKAAESFGSLPN